MIEALDALRISQLRLLAVIATTTQARPGLYMGGVSDTLAWKMPDVPEQEIRMDWDALASQHLVQSYPSGMMTAEGAGNLTVRLTDYGRRFVSFVDAAAAAPAEVASAP